MTAVETSEDAQRLELRRPFWSGWAHHLIAASFLAGVTIWWLVSADLSAAGWVWLVLAWYSFGYWLRHDLEDLREGGRRFVLDHEKIRSARFGRVTTILWSRVTKVVFSRTHLRVMSPEGSIVVPFDLRGYDELYRFVCACVPRSVLATHQKLPIRFHYEVGSSAVGGLLFVVFIGLVGYGMVSSAGGSVAGQLFTALIVGLLLWGIGARFYTALTTVEFHGDRVVVRSLFEKREYATAGLLDMYLETSESDDHQPVTKLQLILSGGEYLTFRDGNVSVSELFTVLKPHYLGGGGHPPKTES